MMVPAGPAVDEVVRHLRPLTRARRHPGRWREFVFSRHGPPLRTSSTRPVCISSAPACRAAKRAPCAGRRSWSADPSKRGTASRQCCGAIAARADDGSPCVARMGPRGAGHYVKMVHNGIEYGDMQLIAEVYDVLSRVGRMKASDIAAVFRTWNDTELRLVPHRNHRARARTRRRRHRGPLVDVILDEAQQKGTGKWMSQDALDLGVATPTINAAVEARLLSAVEERTRRRQ